MASDEFQYEYDYEDYLHEAIMGSPLIIVEGEYDFIYEYILDSMDLTDYMVTPIGHLVPQNNITNEDKKKKEGNLALENFILDLESYAKSKNLEYIPHVLGIIDRDYREYENRLKDSKILYILEYYSIESYFVNREICYKILQNSIRSKRLINYAISDMIYEEITLNLLNELYENAIDKLQKHLNIDKIENLFNINRNFEMLLKIEKGKDLLIRFLAKLQTILSTQKLYKECMNNKITVCSNKPFIKVENIKWSSVIQNLTFKDFNYQWIEFCQKIKEQAKHHKKFCLYLTMKYDIHQLRKFVMEQTDISTLTPIKNRIKELK